MFLSGIADEGSPQLARQLEAHKDLGWRAIELRTLNGVNFTTLRTGMASGNMFQAVTGWANDVSAATSSGLILRRAQP